jgi:hypothetical protein
VKLWGSSGIGPPNAVERTPPALAYGRSPVEQLAAAAIELASWHLWRYAVPRSELERLARMRNVREACAALELRRRQGRVTGEQFAVLDALDEDIEARLAVLRARGPRGHACADRIRELRAEQWRALNGERGLTPEQRAAIAARLDEVYASHLEAMLRA